MFDNEVWDIVYIQNLINKTKIGKYHWESSENFEVGDITYYKNLYYLEVVREISCCEVQEISINYTVQIYVFLNGCVKIKFADFVCDDAKALKCLLDGTNKLEYIWKIDVRNDKIVFEVENKGYENYVQEDFIGGFDYEDSTSAVISCEEVDTFHMYEYLEDKFPSDFRKQLYEAIIKNMKHFNRLTDSAMVVLKMYLLQDVLSEELTLPDELIELK